MAEPRTVRENANTLTSEEIGAILPHRYPFALVDRILDYEPGLYTRVNELMEKYYYGGEELKEYELRLLYRFLTMIRSSRKNLTLLERFRMRYDL